MPLEIARGRGIARQLDVPPIHYDERYHSKYIGYDASPIAGTLNLARVALVRRHYPAGKVLDVGVGAGRFLRTLDGGPHFGFDVNPVAVEWLKASGQWADPYRPLPDGVGAVTFWDSLEHLREPGELLGRFPVGTFVFVSMPIFADLRDVYTSKHRRDGEHWHYFSVAGLLGYLADLGYRHLETNDAETVAGRESILSFAFNRERGS